MELTVKSWVTAMLCSGCVCAMLLYICPKSQGRSVLTVGCVCVMILSFLSPLDQIRHLFEPDYNYDMMNDSESYDSNSLAVADSIQKQLIAQECETYILNEAIRLGAEIDAVEVELVSADGTWIPYEVTYNVKGGIPSEFYSFVEEDFGIDFERQHTHEIQNTDETTFGK